MIKRKHSKLCLRRVSSRSTLVPEDRHSKICIRNRGHRLRNRVHSIYFTLRNGSERRDYFTKRLPAEIRLLIYTYALDFDTPIILDRNPKRGPKSKKASILLVNRLTYTEALPILHELNTIVISREEFCNFPTDKRPQLTVKPELVEQLHIRDLAASPRCAAREASPWPRTKPPCQNCSQSILGLINTLRLKPRLKEVSIDYYVYPYAIQALMHSLSASGYPSQQIQLICTGIGRYQVSGEILHGIKFELLDVPLVMIWTRVLKLPVRYPYATNYGANRRLLRELQPLERRMGLSDLAVWMVKIAGLIQNHDAYVVPANFADIWPDDVPMNFRTVESLGTAELLHEMNVQLRAFLESGSLLLQDLVLVQLPGPLLPDHTSDQDFEAQPQPVTYSDFHTTIAQPSKRVAELDIKELEAELARRKRARKEPPPALYRAQVDSLADSVQKLATSSTSNVNPAIMKRIKECLSRANHPTTVEQEAHTAMHFATRLMDQHTISKAEVLANETTESRAKKAEKESLATRLKEEKAEEQARFDRLFPLPEVPATSFALVPTDGDYVGNSVIGDSDLAIPDDERIIFLEHGEDLTGPSDDEEASDDEDIIEPDFVPDLDDDNITDKLTGDLDGEIKQYNKRKARLLSTHAVKQPRLMSHSTALPPIAQTVVQRSTARPKSHLTEPAELGAGVVSKWPSHQALILFRDDAINIARQYAKDQGLKIRPHRKRSGVVHDRKAYDEGVEDGNKIDVHGKRIEAMAWKDGVSKR